MLIWRGITGRHWFLQESFVPRELELEFGSIAARILANRNVDAQYILRGFSLIVKVASDFNVEEAVEEIVRAIRKKERIVIFADGDVDGITGSVFLYSVLKAVGANVNVVLSSRKRGYGLNKELLRKLEGLGSVLITVDNGINSAKELSITKMKTIVIDHHNPPDNLPRAIVISSKLSKSEHIRGLSSAGMVFYVCKALLERLNSEIDLRIYLPLVALGTLADVMPLNALNRRFVVAGMKILNRCLELNVQKIGLIEMLRYMNVKKVGTRDLTYGVIPRLNAPGRLGMPELSFNLLLSKDVLRIKHLINKIENLNRFRKYLTREAFKSAISQVKEGNVIVARLPKDMGPVGGIVASKLASTFSKPAIVLHGEGELLKGSIRAPASIDAFGLIRSLSHSLEQFGGHRNAVGFFIAKKNLDSFLADVESAVSGLSKQYCPFDCELDMKNVSPEVFNQIKSLEPFGEGFPEPVFISKPAHNLKLYFESEVFKPHIFKKDIKVIYSLGESVNSFIVKDVVYGSI
ncbi:MAG: DHHA1 domain-containing protein [Aquificaceae bacterium]|nr:DHHA1 domain-containing protein [Aquificaceae bacterium]MDW8237053.1 DHHA1 domain-containing protein [Aquificaceae bacterium]